MLAISAPPRFLPRLGLRVVLVAGSLAPAAAGAQTSPGSGDDARHVNADENLTVRGHHSRFQPPPGAHYDPKFDAPGTVGALHDQNTGTDLSNFGGAYSAANPAAPLNPALRNGTEGSAARVGPR
ncbi:hypothetical protein [Rhizosaccharibacter radicis]|uniref:Uncharacterized protein n=1 Tax=Rhizosaccharibacter radicis TaxID=2782605 RepID=A0ABT1VUW2_9PROT|nr:hypothetical protein [Acetobacteraceae bacterium KSS12]